MSASDITEPKLRIGQKEYNTREMKIKLANLKMHLPEALLLIFDKVIQQDIIEPIKTKMAVDGISLLIVNKVRAERTVSGLTITWKIISDYKAINGFPVAKMIEGGRRAFYLRPKISQIPKKDRERAHREKKLPWALSWVKEGVRFFSEGHTIPEYKARKYIETIIEQSQGKIQDRINQEMYIYMEHVWLG